ncbi:MAG: hypothetical protein JSW27_04570 [Phycisphaerales bacterium]|nr:MAG: hypothetical protein JSW27_04570 [Phycisphaerales bacterium]
MFKDERDFKKVVAGMRIDTEPDPAHRERLRREMLARFEAAGGVAVPQTPRVVPRPRRFPVILVRLAVAAGVIVAVGVGIQQVLRLERGPLTFNQVKQATQKMAWLHAVVTEYRDGAVRTDQQWDNFVDRQAYTKMADGSILHADYGAGQKKFLYSPQVKAMVITELPDHGLYGAQSAHTLVDAFAVFAAQDDVTTSEWTDQYEGKSVRVFELDRSNPGLRLDDKTVSLLKIRLMADPETKRVVAAHVEKQGRRGALLAREEWVISYPQSGPASVHDLGVPAAVKVIDQTTQPIGTPGEPRSVSTPADTGRSQWVPVEIELPKPLFVGTPENNRVPNLEKPRGRPRPPFLAPPGTKNVARGKPVTSSEDDPLIGTLEMVTDGDKEAADGSFVELGPGLQHITLDLESEYEIYAVVVWHYHQQPRVYFDVVVQVSNDPSFGRDNVRTVFNNDVDSSAGLARGRDRHYTETNEGKLIDAQGVRARYVRLYSQGNTSDDLNHYIEVEVYGRPAR